MDLSVMSAKYKQIKGNYLCVSSNMYLQLLICESLKYTICQASCNS